MTTQESITNWIGWWANNRIHFLRCPSLPAMVGPPPLGFLFDTWTGGNGCSRFSLSCTGSWLCGHFPFELIPAEDVGCVRSSRLGSSLLECWPRDWLCIEEVDVMVVWDRAANIGGNDGSDGGNADETACSSSWALKQSRAAWALSWKIQRRVLWKMVLADARALLAERGDPSFSSLVFPSLSGSFAAWARRSLTDTTFSSSPESSISSKVLFLTFLKQTCLENLFLPNN